MITRYILNHLKNLRASQERKIRGSPQSFGDILEGEDGKTKQEPEIETERKKKRKIKKEKEELAEENNEF